jgi:hypothetical protein
MSRDNSGNKARAAEDRQKRKAEPKTSQEAERERNVGHKDAEEHSRVAKGNRG